MGAFDTTYGALLLGAFLNTYLYALTSAQYASYFNGKFGDPVWIKLLVVFLLCLDSVHSFSIIYMTWVYLITHMGDPTFLMYSVWPLPLTGVVIAIIAFVVQNFLVLRIYRLLGQKWLWYLFIGLTTGTMALGMYLGVTLMTMTYTEEFRSIDNRLTICWMVMECVVDTSIAGILFVTLQRSRTGFKRSDAVIDRLLRSAIQSGIFASIVAALALITFLALPNTMFYSTFGIPIGRAYTYSLMDTLLCRKEIRGILHGSGGGEGGINSFLSIFDRSEIPMQGIRKDVTTEVHFNSEVSSSKHDLEVSNSSSVKGRFFADSR